MISFLSEFFKQFKKAVKGIIWQVIFSAFQKGKASNFKGHSAMLAFLKACVRRSKDNSVQKDNIRILENEQSQGIKEIVKWLEASYTQMCVVLHNTNICMHTILQKGVFSVENVDVFYYFEDGRALFWYKKRTHGRK